MSGFPATRETWRKLQEMYTWYKRHIRNGQPLNPPSTFAPPPAPTFAIAKEDIARNATGEVKLCKLVGSGPPTAMDPEVLRNVRNYVHTNIWEGSLLQIEYCTVPESGGIWHVAKAWSATKIRGQVVGTLSSGNTTKTMDNLLLMNGYFNDSSLTFYNVFSDSAADNAVGIVDWNDAESRWELTAVVCS